MGIFFNVEIFLSPDLLEVHRTLFSFLRCSFLFVCSSLPPLLHLFRGPKRTPTFRCCFFLKLFFFFGCAFKAGMVRLLA